MYKYLILCLISLSTLASTKVLFLGDSLTAGYGIDEEKAYPFLIKDILKTKYDKDIKVINASTKLHMLKICNHDDTQTYQRPS